MSFSPIFRRAVSAAALCAAVSATSVQAAAPYSAVYAFGDSLSDNGNLYALTYALTGGLDPAPQLADYYLGRLSNGPVAVEVMSSKLALTLYDYAYAGALTNEFNGAAVKAGLPEDYTKSGLLSQVNTFKTDLAKTSSAADANALYFVWAGANDFGYLGYTDAVGMAARANLSSSVHQLYDLGARQFFVPNLPDLGITPGGLVSGFSSYLTGLSEGFNTELQVTFSNLAATLPGAHIQLFDSMGAQRELTYNSPAGITNVTDACFSGFVGESGTHCANPDGYVYWDREHPSAVTHAYLGNLMAAAVPEPQTLLLMGLGVLGLLGHSARRARRG